MLLGIDNFEQFKIFFDVIYDITEFVELQLFQTHMTCSILDKAHTRFMSVTFKKEFFSLYEVDGAESVTLFAEDLHKIVKSASKIDSVTLRTDESHLICKFESQNGNSRVFEFVLPSEFIESPQPPSIPLPVTYNLQLSDLRQGIKDLKIIGTNEIEFHVNDGLVKISAGTEVSTDYSSNIHVDVETDVEYSSRFTLDYIEELLKFGKINKVVEFRMGSDNPLVYSFEDEIMGVEVKGMIAPRIEID